MALTAPNYVQGQYTVAQRDTILTRANKYPDPSQGIGGQVPTLTPDGYVLWRNMPSGEGGTANANIAYIEETSTASQAYVPGDYLIYNESLYKVTVAISAGDTITPGTNCAATTVGTELTAGVVNDNLLDNACFDAFIINQRGQSSYSGEVSGIDRWYGFNANTSITVNSNSITYAGASSRWIQRLENALPSNTYTLSALVKGDAEGQIRAWNGSTLVFVSSYLPKTTNWSLVTATGTGVIDRVGIQIFSGGGTSEIKAVKLERGSVQTLAHLKSGELVLNSIPNYGTELLKCQRFFQIFRTQSLRPTYGADFRPPMATAQPTLGTISIGGTTYYTASSE